MKRILIIGGTGMLSEMTLHYANSENKVLVIARTAQSIEALRRKAIGNLSFLQADYIKADETIDAIKENGPFDLAVLWIHNTGQELSDKLKSYLITSNPLIRIVELKGSSSRNPATTTTSEWLVKYPNNYSEVILGFKIDKDSSRWLTNEEISQGTIDAIEKNARSYTIGVTEPWELRP
jgi:hypothetical protein